MSSSNVAVAELTGYTAAATRYGVGTSRMKTQLQFAQAPGKTTSLNVKDFTNEGVYGFHTAFAAAATQSTQLASSVTQSYEFRIMEYANLRPINSTTLGTRTSTYTNYACGNMGNQFRPLKEVDKYGRVNPFQDPTRGVIPA